MNAQADPETEWQWAVEGLREVNDHALKEGIVIAVEPLNRFETNFLNRHDQALALANEVGPELRCLSGCLPYEHGRSKFPAGAD